MPRDDRKSHPCPCPWCPRSRCTCPEKGQWWSSALMNAVPRHTPESQWSEYADVYCKWLRSQKLIGLAPHVNHDVDGQHYPEQWSHLTNTNWQIATSCMHVLGLWQANKQKEQAMRTTCCMMLWSKCRTLMRKPWSPDPGQCKNCLRVSTVSTGKAAVQKWNHVKPRGQRQCLQALVAVANSPASPSEPPEQGASLSGSEPIS